MVKAMIVRPQPHTPTSRVHIPRVAAMERAMTFHRASGWRAMKLMARGNWPLETRPAGSKGGACKLVEVECKCGGTGKRVMKLMARGNWPLETRPAGSKGGAHVTR